MSGVTPVDLEAARLEGKSEELGGLDLRKDWSFRYPLLNKSFSKIVL